MPETWTLAELVAEAAAWLETLPPPKNGQVRAVPDERTVRYYATIGLVDRPAAMRGRTALYGRRHLAQVVAIKRLQSTGRSLAEIQALWPTLDDVTLARMTGVQVGMQAGAKPKAAARKDFWKREIEPQIEASELSQQRQPQPQPRPLTPYPQPKPAGFADRTGNTAIEPPESTAPTPTYPQPKPASGFADRTGNTPIKPPEPNMPNPDKPTPLPSPGAPIVLPVPTFTAYPTGGGSSTPTITVPLDDGVSIVIALADDAAISLAPADVRALRAAAAPLAAELAKRGLIAVPKDTLEEP